MNKTERLEIRLTTSEKELIKNKSQEANLSISKYVIRSAMDKDVIVIDGLNEFSTQLRRIGNNINQITKKVNEGIITCPDLDNVKKELGNLWQSLNSLITKSV